MSTSGIVIHYIGCGWQSLNPQEIHRFKWEFCVRFVRFQFARLSQEHNPGVKQELPVFKIIYIQYSILYIFSQSSLTV